MAISGTTLVVGIVGQPIAHSLSPAIHNAAFAASSLDFAYVPLPVLADRVGDAIRGLSALGFAGANVTVPYKSAVLPFLDELHGDAVLLDAVNTIVVSDGRLCGHNTDVAGFGGALRELTTASLTGVRCLVLGAGGAARAVALALAREGAILTIVNRTLPAAEELLEILGRAGLKHGHRALSLEALSADVVQNATVVVNATSIGLGGEGKVPAVLVDNLRRGHDVFDVVYGQEPTRLVAEARLRGARAADGLSMLVWQAAAAFELWTGRRAPVDVMRSAVTGE